MLEINATPKYWETAQKNCYHTRAESILNKKLQTIILEILQKL